MPGPDFTNIDSLLDNFDPLAKTMAKRARQFLKDIGVPAAWSVTASAAVGLIVGAVLAILGTLISLVVQIAAPLVVVFLRVLTKIRTETVPEQVEISASVLSEFLATEITPAHIKPGKSPDETIAAATTIGTALLARLEKEFTNGQGAAGVNGERAAGTFAGYGVNFAVQNTIISTLADSVSFHLLENFRELGVEVAQNLGLGRLVRQALRPLVQETISTPYTKQMKARYRQDTLSEAQLVRGMVTGYFSEQYVRVQLAEKGYAEGLIDELIRQLTPRLTDSEAERLLRFGMITQDQAHKNLVDGGVPENIVAARLDSIRLARIEHLEQQHVSEAWALVQHRFITESEFALELDKTHLSGEEKQWWRERAALYLGSQHKRLSVAEIMKAHEEGHITLEEFDQWAESEGYTTDDAVILRLILLTKEVDDEKKKQAAQARAAVKAAKPPK